MRSHYGRAYFQRTAKRTTNLASTNSSTLKAFPIPLPSVREQLKILDQVSKEADSLDSAIRRAVESVELVREYGACLVANVVTGKLDVREAAANLPGLHTVAASDETAGVRKARCAPAADHEEARSELAG